MQLSTEGPGQGTTDVLSSLGSVAAEQGLAGLSRQLTRARELVAEDVAAFAPELEGERLVDRAARHLLSMGGKRLRPLCLSLCARLGDARAGVVRDLAAAVELVHCATLLHDDVVDLGETRRGRPTARMVYGNAASVFAGDWLLVHALRRVRAHDVPGVLDALLATIEEMIAAESLQLENRGRPRFDRDTYLRVARGKTASLFRWACLAGARAGGLLGADEEALVAYGEALGIAFQIVDDLLDVAGDPVRTGKGLFADLHEGKVSCPLIVLVERDPQARALLEWLGRSEAVRRQDEEALLAALRRVEAGEACRRLAETYATAAAAQIERFPRSLARDGLHALALAVVHRDR